jgi:hypothetical protein
MPTANKIMPPWIFTFLPVFPKNERVKQVWTNLDF